MVQVCVARSLKLLKKLTAHKQKVNNVVFSPDGQKLASVDNGGSLLVHSLSDYKQLYSVKKRSALYALDFSPDGGALAYGGMDKRVYQYRFTQRKEDVVVASGQPYWITALGYSPDGEYIALGDESCDVWLYRLEDRKLVFHSKHHVECWLSSVAWAPDNKTFLFGCRPNSHAGKPAVYQPLVAQEAAQSAPVLRARRSIEAKAKELDQVLEQPENRALRDKLQKLLSEQQKLMGQQPPKAGRKAPSVGELLAGVQKRPGPTLSPGTYTVNTQEYQAVTPVGAAQLQKQLRSLPTTAPMARKLRQLDSEIRKLKKQIRTDQRVAKILKDVDGLRKLQKKAYRHRMGELQQNFIINQWKVRR